MTTIYSKSLKIADEQKLSTIVAVMDQALYCEAQQIRWSNNEYEERIILRLGEFHTLMSFLAIIGKRFRDAELEDIFIESGLVAQNSLNGVMNGHHYNRSIRAHKIMAEALESLRWQSFIEQTDKTTVDIVNTTSEELYLSYKNKTFLNILEQENIDSVLKTYSNYVKQHCLESPTFKFWTSYLEMVEIMLLFQRATREGNWILHLSTVSIMMPWYFAYDRVNYARYLPVYWTEMVNLEERHPSIYQEFLKGHFVVQRQQECGFNLTACDQVIEQTFNRESKSKGGLTYHT
ncbi:hypothetical protein AVEN_118711-1 [Araneus ventricosus]|uniref:Uncharacterized protein n=1 Tax=Araneus ventricosus TaxID=182803 RepID=A0A4Y2BXF2_ARAVE|nr:hypothetical protein AVEN_118711-1 [Araneus ventricosus]